MSDTSFVEEITEIETQFVADEMVSSEDPPMDEWSSRVFEKSEENLKKLLYAEGLYDPGSGEICAQYISMSESEVLRHPYYNYPAVPNPGIQAALLKPELKIVYPDDGQELYLATCKDMGESPVRLFHRGLVESDINLSYYCVSSGGIRAMALALGNNRIVKSLDLTDNFLNEDACYHLSQMFITNGALEKLNLSGCKIGPSGVKNLVSSLTMNRGLKTLILNKNDLGDQGCEYLAEAMAGGFDIQSLYLSYNSISASGVNAITEAIQQGNKLKTLDLSWNTLVNPGVTFRLLATLGNSKIIEEVNLSWCSLTGVRVGTGLKTLLNAPNIKYLYLGNNRLSDEAILSLISSLNVAKKLSVMDISSNPLTYADTLKILAKLKLRSVKVETVYMDNVCVNREFIELLEKIKRLKSKKNLVVTYGDVAPEYKCVGKDFRELVLDRTEYLLKRNKKNPVDIALVVLQIEKEFPVMMSKDFSKALTQAGVKIDEDLVNAIVTAFIVPKPGKLKKINITLLADFVRRKWPDRKLPPTPPPEPEPEPEPIKTKPKAKGKKK